MPKKPIKERMKDMEPYKPDTVLVKREKEMAAINKKILKAIEKESLAPVQLSWLPTKVARTSFFSPLAKADMNKKFTEKVFKSSWGSVTMLGPLLTVIDESVFLGLLLFAQEQKSTIIKVSYKRMCEMLNISVQGRNYAKIKKCVWRMAQTSFLFELKDGTWSIERILQGAQGSKGYSWVEIDPWFYNHYLKNEITRLDMGFRQSLKGDVTKCLYRFLSSHRGTQRYHTDTLIEALNMNPRRPLYKNRDALKKAFGQLRNRKFLSFRYDEKTDLFHEIELNKKLSLSQIE